MKKKMLLVVLLIVCFVPSVVAYASYKQTQNAPVDVKTAVTIEIDDINGRTFTLTKTKDGDDADNMIKFFLGLTEKAQQIVALPDSLMAAKFFKVKIATAVKEQTSECYFSSDPQTCYMRMSDGTTYKIDPADAEMFITTEYAESLYTEAAMPSLTLSNSYDVMPDHAIWQYRNYTGSFVDADTSALVLDDVESYELEGGFNLTFDQQPDLCTVKITDAGGNVLFEDNLSALSLFNMNTTQQLDVEVSAKWFNDPSRSYCGEVEYKFSSLVTAPAEFYLGMPKVKSGYFTAVTALNVTKPENIRVTSTMSVDQSAQPIFYKYDKSTAVGFIAVPQEVPSGVYTLTFTYGGTTQDTNITVENVGIKSKAINMSSEIRSYMSTEKLDAFAAVVNDLTSKSVSGKLFSGSFGEGVPDGASYSPGFGYDIYLNGEQTPLYRNNGVSYKTSSAGMDVTACNAGEVVYASSECGYAGNMVVIDHGLGLKTWYYRMGSINVSVGDKVEKGAKIGTTGQTGFAYDVGVHIAMSVGRTFVCPYDTWSSSELYGKVIIAKIDE